MTADDPPDVAAVLAAIVPAQRQPLDEPCDCETHRAERAADTARADWRDLWDARYTAEQIRTTREGEPR